MPDEHVERTVSATAPTIMASSAPEREEVPPVVAGYDLLRIIGRGAMGIVWEAFEHRFERRVALKVHAVSSNDVPDNSLWAEAFVAARIGDPGIVRVLDVGFTLDDRRYYAMDLVEGTDLASILADGALAPRRAVSIAADIARAAAAAHQHGVVHRDIKPRNVIIDLTGRARVVDFGVAFDVRSGEDPFAGTLAGSPAYMAPEQTLGLVVSPKTDVFAIGVILYEMLTGERPFSGNTPRELFAEIGQKEPPPPSTLNPNVHADLDRVVARCLAKSPDDRFGSAATLFATLEAIAEGRSVEPAPPSATRRYAPKAASSPPERPTRDAATKHLGWSWHLRSSPEALWPFVADTDRFNKAVGLAPVKFADERGANGMAERIGAFRAFGLDVRWREYPFEWIKNRMHSVFRWYRAGPIAALWNQVSLHPLEGGGTELKHDIWLSPQGVLGHVAAFVELDRKLGPAVDRFYRRLDEVLVAKSGVDPFEAPHAPSFDQRAIVDAGCARLHAEGFAPNIVERLAMMLLTLPDGVLGSLRPYELAESWGTDPDQTLDAFVHAARAGIVEPIWDVVCPKCMIAHESLASLAKITRVGTCSACATSFERDLRDSVELVFTPHPAVRNVERLTYCAGSPAKRPHVVLQQVLDPHEERVVRIDLPRGTYRIITESTSTGWELVASAVGFESSCEVWTADNRVCGGVSIVRAGPVELLLQNTLPHEDTFRLELPGTRPQAVAATTALTHPTFRAAFSQELLARGEHLRVRQLAFLFVEVLERQSLFERAGDADACAELSRLEELVRAEATANEGTMVPSTLETFVVGFPTPLRALRAALALRERVSEAKLTSPIAVAAHDGRCIALTRDGKIEFFGETLHRGQALLRACPRGGIALSASFAADHAVAVAIHESGLQVGVQVTGDGPYAGRRVTLLRSY